MNCLYCRHSNPEGEHRCERCGRRLQAAPARPAPDHYVSFQATALAPAPSFDAEPAAPVAETPKRAMVARQTRLFAEESPKVLQFPPVAKPPAEPKPKQHRRPAQRPPDSQAFLDFLPPAPHAPRTLKTSVEAVIYCDAPVATPVHRAVGSAVDFGLIGTGIAVFLLSFYMFGGEFARLNLGVALGYCGAFLAIAALYGMLWLLGGAETPGQWWTGLRLINFDGTPVNRKERSMRHVAAWLSFFSAGLGFLWSLADEESLTWHDHVSKTFPTIRN
jgi:uncharacterized RDD family membrane protein YckC